ncbi:MAG: hypothetical protein WC655_13540, partial [Candidatus Hydrogenedentales bacterium]
MSNEHAKVEERRRKLAHNIHKLWPDDPACVQAIADSEAQAVADMTAQRDEARAACNTEVSRCN